MEELTVNYAGAVSAITSQLSDALGAGLPIMGIMLGVVIGIAFFKKLGKGGAR